MSFIGEDLFHFQASLIEAGSSFQDFIRENYISKWTSKNLAAAGAIRTTLVNSVTAFLVKEGLLNMERVSLSPVTDPLAHDVEHVPTIHYKGMPYVTTHSMIYSKFLACFNPYIKGIFVDSHNIRLEIESPQRKQRGKYLIDFSQIDVEMRRNRGVDLERYKNDQEGVKKILREDMETALDFFERMIIYAMEEIVSKNDEDLKTLGVVIDVPKQPFPRFRYDEGVKKYGKAELDIRLGDNTTGQFFWITGIPRENYDLIYPYLLPDNSKYSPSDVTSDMVYNYDVCARSIIRDTGKFTPAVEILSGAIREWLYEPIIERLIDSGVIKVRPVFENGNITNIEELDGYGPFLAAVAMKDSNGKPFFPDTMGGGIGVERSLYALLRGPEIEKIDDLTFFGKNPDSYPIFLF